MSFNISSTKYFVLPYTLVILTPVSFFSVIGNDSGSPYTVHELENTNVKTRCYKNENSYSYRSCSVSAKEAKKISFP